MATGAPGTNGVWLYGEDDSEATFSALLNKAGSTVNTQLGLDRARLDTLEAKPLSGLIPISPTSIDKTGGTASTAGLGIVSFSGISTISLNGVFTTNYSRYRIQLNNFASSGNVLINFRGRTSGTDFTTANYYWSYVFSRVSTATPGGNGASSDSKLSIGGMNSPASSTCGGWIEIDRPKAANNKIVTGQFWGADGTGMIDINSGGIIYNTASFDGFTIYPNSGTLSGDIQVFAFND